MNLIKELRCLYFIGKVDKILFWLRKGLCVSFFAVIALALLRCTGDKFAFVQKIRGIFP